MHDHLIVVQPDPERLEASRRRSRLPAAILALLSGVAWRRGDDERPLLYDLVAEAFADPKLKTWAATRLCLVAAYCRPEDSARLLVRAMLDQRPDVRQMAYSALWSEMERDDAKGCAIMGQMVGIMESSSPEDEGWQDLLVLLRHLRKPGAYEH